MPIGLCATAVLPSSKRPSNLVALEVSTLLQEPDAVKLKLEAIVPGTATVPECIVAMHVPPGIGEPVIDVRARGNGWMPEAELSIDEGSL